MDRSRAVFLMSDFGASSYYQGVMKGVIASTAPEVAIHDITHRLEAGNIEEASFVLQACLDYLPSDAVVVIVVDPGVGTDRKILLARFGERLVLAPDNGLLAELLDRPDAAGVRAVTDENLFLASPSATFHGRDVFAPVAAKLATGLSPEAVGPEVRDVRGREQEEETRQVLLEAPIVHVDAFGNLVTSVSRDSWIKNVGTPSYVIEAGTGRIERLSRTFEDAPPNQPVAYIGSTGHLEVAIRGGNAAEAFGVGTGDLIRVFKR